MKTLELGETINTVTLPNGGSFEITLVDHEDGPVLVLLTRPKGDAQDEYHIHQGSTGILQNGHAYCKTFELLHTDDMKATPNRAFDIKVPGKFVWEV